MVDLKKLFLLDPEVAFLNHGSFGACPRPVFDAYQNWQRRLEFQPVLFIREYEELDRKARGQLGAFIHCGADDVAFVNNVTHGVNVVARSLHLGPGDEILTTDQEYGACNNAWNFMCRKTGAAYVHRTVHLPVSSPMEIVEEFWQGVTPNTRVIYLSHITSGTSIILPIAEICCRARERGILTVIDGAHAVGQLSLDMQAIGADFYVGNCHKWLMSPKGAGFLYARPEVQRLVEPLLVSRPFEPDADPGELKPMVQYFHWTGTRDPSAYLSVPEAIHFMEVYHWDEVRRDCHALLRQAIERISDLSGLGTVYAPGSDFYVQMGIAPLPPIADPAKLKNQMYEEFKVEIPLTQWQGRFFVRISVQGYNTQSDIDRLVQSLEVLLPRQ
jgi:isopenicillin-N epimerase